MALNNALLKRLEDTLAKKIDKLTTVRTKVTKKPSDYDEINIKSVVVVQFVSKEYTEPKNKGRMASLRQEVTYTFNIRLLFRQLRSHQDSYPVLEAIQDELIGSDCLTAVDKNIGRIWIDTIEFAERDDQTCWIWDIKIKFSSIETKC